MIPVAYENFFTASTQASAALTGLLFVAVSIAPHRVFGEGAESGRQAQALSAFTAFVNVFFISFLGLIPNQRIGPAAVVLGALAAIQTLSLLRLLPRWHRQRTLIRGLLLLVGSAVLYGYEVATGLELWFRPSDTGALTTLLILLLSAYGVGLVRAWQVLGAPSHGVVSRAVEKLDARLRRSDMPRDDGPPPEGAGRE